MVHLRPGIRPPISSNRSISRLSSCENSDTPPRKDSVEREAELHDGEVDQMNPRGGTPPETTTLRLLDQHRDA